MKIGYARVSIEEQSLDLQIEVLTEAGCDRIITDQEQRIQERTKAGLCAAKKHGKRLGRPPDQTETQITHAKTAIEAKRETVSGMAEIHSVNRSTLQWAIARDVEGAV